MSRVCNKHGIPEYCPDGVCRWCPPEPAKRMKFSDFAVPLLDVWRAPRAPPLPIATCLHDGAFFDYGGTLSCAACGKVFTPKPASATEAAILAGYGLQ